MVGRNMHACGVCACVTVMSEGARCGARGGGGGGGGGYMILLISHESAKIKFDLHSRCPARSKWLAFAQWTPSGTRPSVRQWTSEWLNSKASRACSSGLFVLGAVALEVVARVCHRGGGG
jgi:hypothetical protein